jgi:hypothetical protein
MNKRFENVLFLFLQLLLVVSLTGTVYLTIMSKVNGKHVEYALTTIPRDHMWNSMMEQYRGRTSDIAHFTPPADAAQLPLWADSVQKHIVFPAAVFLWKDSTIQWVAMPPHLKAWAADLPRIINPATPRGERIKPDSVGSMIMWNGNVNADSLHAHVKAFQRLGEAQAWGILYRFDDARRELANELLTYDPKDLLKSRQWVFGAWNNGGLNFRMFSGDSLLASTPRLDTLNSKYTEKERGVHFEYYVTVWDQMMINMMLHPRLLYFLVFVECIMMIGLYFFHRRIKELVVEENRETK